MIHMDTVSDCGILAAVEPIMDDLMQGSTKIDHARHTRDVTDRIKCASNEPQSYSGHPRRQGSGLRTLHPDPQSE